MAKKKYNSLEELRAANNEKAQRYYKKNSKKIRFKRIKRYKKDGV
jgi:hypothetical protein